MRAQEGKLVELDLERALGGSLAEAASALAAHAAEYAVHSEGLEVWRYQPRNPPTPSNVEEYLVLEKLSRRISVSASAGLVPIDDSPRLRKHLREHVFVVEDPPDKDRCETKPRLRERIVFMAT